MSISHEDLTFRHIFGLLFENTRKKLLNICSAGFYHNKDFLMNVGLANGK